MIRRGRWLKIYGRLALLVAALPRCSNYAKGTSLKMLLAVVLLPRVMNTGFLTAMLLPTLAVFLKSSLAICTTLLLPCSMVMMLHCTVPLLASLVANSIFNQFCCMRLLLKSLMASGYNLLQTMTLPISVLTLRAFRRPVECRRSLRTASPRTSRCRNW